jgi:hypothetical protein
MKNRLSYTFLIISFRIVVAILTQIKYNLLFTEIHFQVIERKNSPTKKRYLISNQKLATFTNVNIRFC